MKIFTNPIIEGFAPDPSTCAVGDDFYMVTSTFAYFPGLPIYHSKDLVNWQQIGNVLNREKQLNLAGAGHSDGIYAPCIRYHNGIFYVITTNVTHGGNFLVTATSPEGPWSDPYYLDNAPGIDPSLFFDKDNRAYYVGTRPRPEGVRWNGDWEIWLQELDLATMSLIGVSTKIWKGAMKDVIWPEGPHIYKRNQYYYLLIAEGGTSFEHSITVARSTSISGPYESNPCNPILTHRHLGKDYPVQNVGHGDLVEDLAHNWYLTCLASRPYEGHSNLGRETFLALVTWENDWPVVNPGLGRLLAEQEHYYEITTSEQTRTIVDFSQGVSHNCLYLRNPQMEHYQIADGGLHLKLSKVRLNDIESPSYIGIRQETMNYELETGLSLSTDKNGEEAGLTIIQNDTYSIRLVLGMFEDKQELRVVRFQETEEVLARLLYAETRVNLIIESKGQNLSFYYRENPNGNKKLLRENVCAKFLSTEIAGGFVGCTMGIYGSSNGQESETVAVFDKLVHKKLLTPINK